MHVTTKTYPGTRNEALVVFERPFSASPGDVVSITYNDTTIGHVVDRYSRFFAAALDLYPNGCIKSVRLIGPDTTSMPRTPMPVTEPISASTPVTWTSSHTHAIAYVHDSATTGSTLDIALAEAAKRWLAADRGRAFTSASWGAYGPALRTA